MRLFRLGEKAIYVTYRAQKTFSKGTKNILFLSLGILGNYCLVLRTVWNMDRQANCAFGCL